jgi:hypothetical protein
MLGQVWERRELLAHESFLVWRFVQLWPSRVLLSTKLRSYEIEDSRKKDHGSAAALAGYVIFDVFVL